VRHIEALHNHEVSPEAFAHTRQQRRLPAELRVEAATMLSMDANPTRVREYMSSVSGHVVTATDIQNIRTAAREQNKSGCPVSKVVDLLRKVPGAEVGVGTDPAGVVQWVTYQTPAMKKQFEAYGDVLIFDATYKVNNRNMPLLLPLVIDSNGDSQIVALFLVVNEETATMDGMLGHFASKNDCTHVKCLMVDKDLHAIACLQHICPNSQVNLCLFHCLHTFR